MNDEDETDLFAGGDAGSAERVAFAPGIVIEHAVPGDLLDRLVAIAGTGFQSLRTGIGNHIPNAFEGWDGHGWPDSYFEQVAAGFDPAVEEWARLVRVIAMRVLNVPSIGAAHDRGGHVFAPAIVRQTVNGIDWHFDCAHLEYPDSTLDLGIESRQWSVITYLNSPTGGELEIADWRPATVGAHPKDSYPLDRELFAANLREFVTPVRGRTVLVPSEYAHRVHPTTEPRKFVTTFIAINEDASSAISFG